MSSVSGDSERKNSHLSVGAVPMMSEGGADEATSLDYAQFSL